MATAARGDQAANVDFAVQIAPIIQEHCIRCHKPGNEKGDISLATMADLAANDYVVPGSPEASYLLDLVTPADEQPPQMPKGAPPLAAEQRALLRRWIAQGATWPANVVLRELPKADSTWWSLQPLAEIAPPEPDGIPDAWRQNPIDRFVHATLVERQLMPSPRADRQTLIRRATYDLTGLPPSPEDVEQFVSDPRADAYERLIDRLLESPQYGEHWGRHWLDVIRFGESRGFERNEIIDNAWPFRDYVIRSLNEDKPFDQFLREHLAGDVLGRDDPDVTVGTTFLVCGPYDDVGNQDPVQAAQIRANTIDEVIRATSEAFLGLTIGCARCHDHKFDPVLQRDYYALYASLAGVRHGSRVVATDQQQRERAEQLRPLTQLRDRLSGEISRLEHAIAVRAKQHAAEVEAAWVRPRPERTGTEEQFEPVPARFVRLAVEAAEHNPQTAAGYRIDEFEVWTAGQSPRNVAARSAGGQASGASRTADDFADAYSAALTIDGRYGARWIAAGPELTITLAEQEQIDRVVFSSDRGGDAGDHSVATFVADYRVEVSLDGQTWTEVANSQDRQPVSPAHRLQRLRQREITPEERSQLAVWKRELADCNRQIAGIPPLPSWWVGNFEQPQGSFSIFLGGDPQRTGATVVPASLSALADRGFAYAMESGALESQRRVRLADWIVDAQNPLTPRVLVNRLWHYHFGTGIVDTPSDFGYVGGRPTHPELLDWLARQLLHYDWRLKPLHRLIMLSETYRQSSEYRQSAAAVDADSRTLWRFPPRRLAAEEIRDTILCVSGRLDRRMGGPGYRLYRYIQDNVATYVPLDEHGPETYRRAVYHQNARSSRLDLISEFDCPDSAFATPRRVTTTTPLQALTLMNHSFSLDMARAWAERLRREAGDAPGDQIRRAFALAYGRQPADDELAAGAALVQTHGLEAFCRALLNSNELIYVQ
jgi:hypothetical protein